MVFVTTHGVATLSCAYTKLQHRHQSAVATVPHRVPGTALLSEMGAAAGKVDGDRAAEARRRVMGNQVRKASSSGACLPVKLLCCLQARL